MEELGPGNRDFLWALCNGIEGSAIWGPKKFHYLIYNVSDTSEKLSPQDTKTPQSISLVSVMTADSNSLTEMQLSGTEWKRIYDETYSQKCRDFVPFKLHYRNILSL